MSKLFSYYDKDTDHVWYQSSNIKYSECLDKKDELKVLTVVFANGTRYRYSNVNVNDYLFFREAVSQGKALNQFIKGKNYPYEKLDNANIDDIMDEYTFRSGNGIFVYEKDNHLFLYNNRNEQILDIDDVKKIEPTDFAKKLLESVGYQVKEKQIENINCENEQK